MAMGGTDDRLRRKYRDDAEKKWKIRDEPSDDVSEWWGLSVEGGRVTMLDWDYEGLSGTIPL